MPVDGENDPESFSPFTGMLKPNYLGLAPKACESLQFLPLPCAQQIAQMMAAV